MSYIKQQKEEKSIAILRETWKQWKQNKNESNVIVCDFFNSFEFLTVIFI